MRLSESKKAVRCRSRNESFYDKSISDTKEKSPNYCQINVRVVLVHLNRFVLTGTLMTWLRLSMFKTPLLRPVL